MRCGHRPQLVRRTIVPDQYGISGKIDRRGADVWKRDVIRVDDQDIGIRVSDRGVPVGQQVASERGGTGDIESTSDYRVSGRGIDRELGTGNAEVTGDTEGSSDGTGSARIEAGESGRSGDSEGASNEGITAGCGDVELVGIDREIAAAGEGARNGEVTGERGGSGDVKVASDGEVTCEAIVLTALGLGDGSVRADGSCAGGDVPGGGQGSDGGCPGDIERSGHQGIAACGSDGELARGNAEVSGCIDRGRGQLKGGIGATAVADGLEGAGQRGVIGGL